MEEKKVIAKNIETNYKVFGSPSPEALADQSQGKPMLILHGWPSSSEKWIQVAELLADKNIMVVVPDLPGFGKSPEPAEAWNLDRYVDWVLEFCNNVPELNSGFYLLGHSFGGALAVKFAVKYNQRVEKLFLVSAAAVRKKTTTKKMWGGVAKIAKVFSFLPGYDLGRKAFYKFIIRKSDYIYQKGVMKESYLKVIADDLSFYMSFLKVPTFIIWGDKDASTSLDQAKVISQKISHSKLIVIPGGTHSLEIQAPEILAQKIIENL